MKKRENLIFKKMKDLTIIESLRVANSTLTIRSKELKDASFAFDEKGKLVKILYPFPKIN